MRRALATFIGLSLASAMAVNCGNLSGITGATLDAGATQDATMSASTDASDAGGAIDAVGAIDAGEDGDGAPPIPTQCEIGSRTFESEAMNPTNACQTCQPIVAITSWSNVTDGTPCGTGGAGICSNGTCVSGCEIGGVYAMTNAVNPSNPCQTCQPAKSTSSWSNVADAVSCGNGQLCSAGTCGTQCDINATIYAVGVLNPANNCQSCQPGSSTNAWTNLATGASCGGFGSCAAGVCNFPRSCAPGGAGMTNCGVESENCCTSLEVTGGTYYRTYTSDPDSGAPLNEANPASVSGFRLDKYLVTVGRFRQFVNAVLPDGGTGYLPAAGSGKHTHLNNGQGLLAVDTADAGVATYEPGWLTSDNASVVPTNTNLICNATLATWTATAGTHENLPINCVDWAEAFAFCIWDGGFLPSEAEWEYASGGAQQLEYAWGTAAPGTANQYAIYNCYYPGDGGACSTAPVGLTTLGATPSGQLDMLGEEYEFVLDWHGAYSVPCTDCAYVTTATYRSTRGGVFGYVPPFYSPAGRGITAPVSHDKFNGFRCARTP